MRLAIRYNHTCNLTIDNKSNFGIEYFIGGWCAFKYIKQTWFTKTDPLNVLHSAIANDVMSLLLGSILIDYHKLRGSPRHLMVKVMDCGLKVSNITLIF